MVPRSRLRARLASWGLADLDVGALVLADLDLVSNPWTVLLLLVDLVTFMTTAVTEHKKMPLSTEPASTFDDFLDHFLNLNKQKEPLCFEKTEQHGIGKHIKLDLGRKNDIIILVFNG